MEQSNRNISINAGKEAEVYLENEPVKRESIDFGCAEDQNLL